MIEWLIDLVSLFLHYDVFWYSVVLFFSLILLFYSRDRKVFITALLLVLATTFAAKAFIAEDRPCVAVPGRVDCPIDYGSPSGHAAVAIVLLLGAIGTNLFSSYLLLGLLIFFSRLWLGVHSIEQIVAGIAFGALMYFLVFDVKNRFERVDFGFVRNNVFLEDSEWD
ncbi:MAG: phosphatase PAP2 family protein [Candidatus Micrarchaeota archaeon]